jgi:hypothetical protein
LKLDELAGLAGNEQLVAIYETREELSRQLAEWRSRKELIQKRRSRWEMLERLWNKAKFLPVSAEVAPQIEALRRNRALLAEPDPVPPLSAQLAQALRTALQAERESYAKLHQEGMRCLAEAEMWRQLNEDQRAAILNRLGISGVAEIRVGTEQELFTSLAESSLESWRDRRDALPERFTKALEEAARLTAPTAVRVQLPSATIRNEVELRAWLDEVEKRLRDKLGSGPVVI